jgi:tyrosinase
MLPFFPPKKLFLLLPVVWLCFVPALTAFQITGATGGVNSTTGARPLRYEIHDFANSGAPFDLLILSLIELQTADQADLLSYFQISGL